MMDVITSSFTQGTTWAVLGIGVFITFRLLDLADLSAEGVFPLGGGIAAILIMNNMNPYLATGIAFIGGSLAGLMSGLIHTKLKIPALLTGILMQTGLYSINFHIMGKKPNLPLLNQPTIYTPFQETFATTRNQSYTIVSLLVLVIVITALVFFLHSEIGLALRSTGDNPKMSEANGINVGAMKTLGYMLSGGLIALAGAMVAQKDGFADIGMGVGTIVVGLAAIVIAEVVLPNRPIGHRFVTIILGSFIYRLIIDAILNQEIIEILPTDIRLFSALLLGLVLYLPNIQKGQSKPKKPLVTRRKEQ